MHRHKALYRDLKPENVVISQWDRYLKVVDFGYSTYNSHSGSRESFCGTLEYLCPEKIQGLPYDYSSDIWSLGILLFVMLCDRHPYTSPKEGSMPISSSHSHRGVVPKLRHLSRNIPSLMKEYKHHRKQSAFSSSVQNLISSMLSFRPDERPSISQIKKHPWFSSIDFDQLKEKRLDPPYGCYDAFELPDESDSSSVWIKLINVYPATYSVTRYKKLFVLNFPR